MNLLWQFKPAPALARFSGLAILTLALAGCNRNEVTVQSVPKEAPANPAPAAPIASMSAESPPAHGQVEARAPLTWSLPPGWEVKPRSQMRAASFSAKGKDGQTADISVIPLGSGGPEVELANLEMWRGELEIPAGEKIEPTPVAVGSAQGKLFEIAGGKTRGRILVATVDRDGTTWYFKMKGEDSLVRDQKPAFIGFLKSIDFSKPMTIGELEALPPKETVPAGAAKPGALPPGWQEAAPTQFLLAKYAIQGSGDAKAEVNVSKLEGEGGGLLANVNRWRGQLSLPPIAQNELAGQLTLADVATGKATFVDMTGTEVRSGKKARLIGVVAPQGGQTWFYKLMGDEQIVEQQKEAFRQFVRTADYSHVR